MTEKIYKGQSHARLRPVLQNHKLIVAGTKGEGIYKDGEGKNNGKEVDDGG